MATVADGELGATGGAVFAEGETAVGDVKAVAYQVLIPWCPEQAPRLEDAVEKLPSLQTPVAPAGACALEGTLTNASTRKSIPKKRFA